MKSSSKLCHVFDKSARTQWFFFPYHFTMNNFLNPRFASAFDEQNHENWEAMQLQHHHVVWPRSKYLMIDVRWGHFLGFVFFLYRVMHSLHGVPCGNSTTILKPWPIYIVPTFYIDLITSSCEFGSIPIIMPIKSHSLVRLVQGRWENGYSINPHCRLSNRKIRWLSGSKPLIVFGCFIPSMSWHMTPIYIYNIYDIWYMTYAYICNMPSSSQMWVETCRFTAMIFPETSI
jgi:hypothetical protein